MNYPTIFISHLFVTIKYFLEWYNNSLLTIQRIYLNVLYFALMTRIKIRIILIQMIDIGSYKNVSFGLFSFLGSVVFSG